VCVAVCVELYAYRALLAKRTKNVGSLLIVATPPQHVRCDSMRRCQNIKEPYIHTAFLQKSPDNVVSTDRSHPTKTRALQAMNLFAHMV